MTFGGNLIEFSHPCAYFTEGKAKASTLSLSVLVAIEMFNALNALSEVPARARPRRVAAPSLPPLTVIRVVIRGHSELMRLYAARTRLALCAP